MRVAAVQADTVWESPKENFARLAPAIARAAGLGARLVVLPEMFSTGFSMASHRIAEPPGGPSETFLRERAEEHDVFIGGSIPTAADGPLPFNRFVLAGPGTEPVSYDKIHPFGYGGETEHYAPGRAPVTTTVDGMSCTLFVCYDLRFADRFWQAAARTDCFLVPANWPASRADHWRTLCKARAIENLAYLVGVNRVGDGDGLSYGGGSLVVDPFGEVLAEAGADETVIVADLDEGRVREVRAAYPFLEDR